MPYKDILVHVPDADRGAGSLHVAAGLATTHGAHLTGVYVIPPVVVPGYAGPEIGSVAYDMQRKVMREAEEKAEAAFRTITDQAGVPAEFRADEGHAGEAVSAQGRYADFVVAGQIDPDKDYNSGFRDLPEYVLVHAGRPVLIVPYAGNFSRIGERVVIAWNGSREAARAVYDALPFLQAAKKVTVLAMNPPKGPQGLGDLPGAGIAAQLARHGVTVEVDDEYSGDVRVAAGVYDEVKDDINVGEVLLSRLSDLSADLLVMGGYGQSRIREMIMGGLTRHVMRSMTVPVLMSH